MKNLRAQIPAASRRKAALSAAQHLANLPQLRRARHVAVYLDFGAELSTAPLIALLRLSRRHIYVPWIMGSGRMQFVRLRSGARLRRNGYGIAEPARRAWIRHAKKMDLIVLPVLGFDSEGRRLGMGGGYYDRALAFHSPYRKPWLVGYAYAAQESEQIPTDPWDVELDAVVTEKGILKP